MLLHYSVKGEGPPLILIHGLFGMGENLSMIARALQGSFTIYSVDLRNHGRSFHADTMSLQEMADDVSQLMDELSLDTGVVLGHSLGGKVAMQLALQEPQRVKRLIVADIAPVLYGGHHDGVLAGLNAVTPTNINSRGEADTILKKYIEDAGVRMFLLKSLYRDEAGEFNWRLNVSALETCYDDIRQGNTGDQYHAPCLFIKGENSAYIQEKHRDTINAFFPQASIEMIHNAGHWLHAEQPEAFINVVKRFLML